jgi:hypothetical protein
MAHINITQIDSVLVWDLRKGQTMKGKIYTTEDKIRILREVDRGGNHLTSGNINLGAYKFSGGV